MAGRAARRPVSVAVLGLSQVDDRQTARALDNVGDAVQKLQQARARTVVDQDLVIGTNKVRHGLGRAATGYTLVATVADATFAHAIDDSNKRPDREIWIVVVGAAQPGARMEIW